MDAMNSRYQINTPQTYAINRPMPSTGSRRLKVSMRSTLPMLMIATLAMGVNQYAYADTMADLIEAKTKTASPAPSTFIDPAPVDALTELLSSKTFHADYAKAPNIKTRHIDILYNAEQTASEAGKKVLQTVRQMALDDREIIKGACWDYLNQAFKRAGVGRDTVFRGAYPDGPFVNTDEIQAGDWLYYVNHSYRGVQHSGLFVGWVNRAKNKALILSYAGEHRHEPARYKVYDISDTYNIMRPTL